MQYLCASYRRLSEADNDKENPVDESSSIKSQKMIIDSFAKFNNLTIVKEYVDDGYSGGNFERPGFKEMIGDIEAGKINCVITKDLSRLGREIYKTGRYIEEYFLEKGVRYIAINDSYDSNIGDSMLGIRLSVNDLYLRDVSKKVKTSLRAKQEKGEYIGSFPLYGYKKDPDNRHHLIKDEKVQPVVELIFDLALDGFAPQKIADILTTKKIPIPIVYKQEPRGKLITENDGLGIWKRQTIKNILTSQMYVGHMVQNTYNKLNYNSKKIRKTRVEDQVVIKNTHEGYIDDTTYDKLQNILKKRSVCSNVDKHEDYLLGGLLYCHECGRTIRINKRIYKTKVSHFTQCNLYTRKGKYGMCSSHSLNYDWLEEDILKYLTNICENFVKEYDFSELEDGSFKVIRNKLKKLDESINDLSNELTIHQETIDALYLDKVKGVVSEDMFKRISDKTNLEIKKIEVKLDTLIKEKSKIDPQNKKASNSFYQCKKKVLEYLSLRKPTRDLIVRLIERIEIDKDKNIYVHLKYKEMNIKNMA